MPPKVVAFHSAASSSNTDTPKLPTLTDEEETKYKKIIRKYPLIQDYAAFKTDFKQTTALRYMKQHSLLDQLEKYPYITCTLYTAQYAKNISNPDHADMEKVRIYHQLPKPLDEMEVQGLTMDQFGDILRYGSFQEEVGVGKVKVEGKTRRGKFQTFQIPLYDKNGEENKKLKVFASTEMKKRYFDPTPFDEITADSVRQYTQNMANGESAMPLFNELFRYYNHDFHIPVPQLQPKSLQEINQFRIDHKNSILPWELSGGFLKMTKVPFKKQESLTLLDQMFPETKKRFGDHSNLAAADTLFRDETGTLTRKENLGKLLDKFKNQVTKREYNSYQTITIILHHLNDLMRYYWHKLFAPATINSQSEAVLYLRNSGIDITKDVTLSRILHIEPDRMERNFDTQFLRNIDTIRRSPTFSSGISWYNTAFAQFYLTASVNQEYYLKDFCQKLADPEIHCVILDLAVYLLLLPVFYSGVYPDVQIQNQKLKEHAQEGDMMAHGIVVIFIKYGERRIISVFDSAQFISKQREIRGLIYGDLDFGVKTPGRDGPLFLCKNPEIAKALSTGGFTVDVVEYFSPIEYQIHRQKFTDGFLVGGGSCEFQCLWVMMFYGLQPYYLNTFLDAQDECIIPPLLNKNRFLSFIKWVGFYAHSINFVNDKMYGILGYRPPVTTNTENSLIRYIVNEGGGDKNYFLNCILFSSQLVNLGVLYRIRNLSSIVKEEPVDEPPPEPVEVVYEPDTEPPAPKRPKLEETEKDEEEQEMAASELVGNGNFSFTKYPDLIKAYIALLNI